MIPNIKGMSAAVYIPGQGIWKGVAGVSYTGQPLTADMRMGIASNTKLFVAAMMLKLAENNIISLDDSLKKWLPTYTNVNPDIKIRQLLNHTSGISDPIFISPWMDTINKNPTRVFTPAEVLSWLGAPLFAPGTGYGYSNVNYILAGMIAKNATGYHISRLIRDSILTPLNMDSTFYDVEEPSNGILAHRWWNTIDYHDTSRVGLNTAGGCAGSIFSTASEMVQWYNALFDNRVIRQSSINELTDFLGTGTPGYDYGLGLSRETTQSRTYWGHGGSTWGYRSKMIYDSCAHITVGGFTNCFPSGMESVTFLLYRAIKNHIPGCSGPMTGNTTICAGTNGVTYSVPAIPGATSYVWELPAGVSGSSATNAITVNFGTGATSGVITARGVNSYGAGGYASLAVTVHPKPATPVITQAGNKLSSTAPIGNQWYDANGLIPGATASTFNITAGGTYYCIVTIAGCVSDSSNKINAQYNGISIYPDSGRWSVYPNPAATYFYCNTAGEEPGEMQLNIYSSVGVRVRSVRINEPNQTIPVADLSPGIYLVELSSGKSNKKALLHIVR